MPVDPALLLLFLLLLALNLFVTLIVVVVSVIVLMLMMTMKTTITITISLLPYKSLSPNHHLMYAADPFLPIPFPLSIPHSLLLPLTRNARNPLLLLNSIPLIHKSKSPCRLLNHLK